MLRKPVVILILVGMLTLIAAGVVAAQTPRGGDVLGQSDVYGFSVDIEGITQGAFGFKSVAGMDSETEVIEYQDGDDLILRKRPGRTTYSNLVLEVEANSRLLASLWEWRQRVVEGDHDIMKNGAIIVEDSRGREIARYNFTNAWPAKWEVSAGTDGSRMATEKIEIAVEKVERAR
ncbi:MAG: phage tail protein [Dehalococcoidia bacterium]